MRDLFPRVPVEVKRNCLNGAHDWYAERFARATAGKWPAPLCSLGRPSSRKRSRARAPSMPAAQPARQAAPLDWQDDLAAIRARAHALELAMMSHGMSLDENPYLDALIQQARDVANGLDALIAGSDRLAPQ